MKDAGISISKTGLIGIGLSLPMFVFGLPAETGWALLRSGAVLFGVGFAVFAIGSMGREP